MTTKTLLTLEDFQSKVRTILADNPERVNPYFGDTCQYAGVDLDTGERDGDKHGRCAIGQLVYELTGEEVPDYLEGKNGDYVLVELNLIDDADTKLRYAANTVQGIADGKATYDRDGERISVETATVDNSFTDIPRTWADVLSPATSAGLL